MTEFQRSDMEQFVMSNVHFADRIRAREDLAQLTDVELGRLVVILRKAVKGAM